MQVRKSRAPSPFGRMNRDIEHDDPVDTRLIATRKRALAIVVGTRGAGIGTALRMPSRCLTVVLSQPGTGQDIVANEPHCDDESAQGGPNEIDPTNSTGEMRTRFSRELGRFEILGAA